MARETPVISDFTAGELSPDLYGRTDQPVYYRGASIMKNYIPKEVGGFRKRVGTIAIGHTEGDASALIIFVTLQIGTSYMLEFTENNVNVWKDDILIDNQATSYSLAELDEIQFTWSFPFLTMTHISHPPSRLKWTAADTWTFSVWPIVGIAGDLPFQGPGDYPRCCAAAFQRLAFASSTNEPQAVWETKLGILADDGDSLDFTYFETVTYTVKQMNVDTEGRPTTVIPTYTDVTTTKDVVSEESAFKLVVASESNDAAQWIAEDKDLFVGTASGECVLPGDATAEDPQAMPINTRVGSAPIQGVLMSGGLVFMKSGAKRVVQIPWQGLQNPDIPPEDLTQFSYHLFQGNPIVGWDFMQAPVQMAYFWRADGTVVGLLLNRRLQVLAWWTVETDGLVTSMAVMPTVDGDVVYMVVVRNTDQVMIEKLADQDWVDIEDAHYVDSGVWKTDATAFTVVPLLDHLEGLTVSMIGDGAYLGTAVVTGGEVTLPVACNSAHVGLAYASRVRTMPIVAAANYGTGLLKKKNIPAVNVMFTNTLDLKIGPSVASADSANLGGVDATAPFPVPQDGEERVKIVPTNKKRAYVEIISDLPLPSEVTCIVPDVSAYE